MARTQRLAIPFARLTAALFRESSPAPLKYALSLLGLMSPKVRDGYSISMIGKICGAAHSDVRHFNVACRY